MKLADFGFTEGINEVIAITENEDGSLNTAPIGIIVDDSNSILAKVRLYRSHTRSNIQRTGTVFVNVIWDAVIFSLAAFDDLGVEFFETLQPPVLKNSLVWCEFEAEFKGAYANLKLVNGGVLKKNIRAVNRGFNAVIESLVHATRYIVMRDEDKRRWLKEKIYYYHQIAMKCGGEGERKAFEIIFEKIGLK